jgi:hypothetical protein
MAKGRRNTKQTDAVTGTVDEIIAAIPVLQRVLACRYDVRRQDLQIDLASRLMKMLRELEIARENSALPTHQDKLRESFGKKEGSPPNEIWRYESPEKERAYIAGIMQVTTQPVALVVPRIFAHEIDGTIDPKTSAVVTIFDIEKPLTLAERERIDWLLEYEETPAPAAGGDQ